ncbi:DUF3391 domain-containing protein [Burkholderiaceae bacterium DAT-1]|nr:DUF3391 domain-containing protein [Burkholderiaceae bacterium DAT-1]
MEVHVDVADLQLGMFVCELDRPWLDTPFLMQGFLIDSGLQLDMLVQYCKHVKVDLGRSLGGMSRWSALIPFDVLAASSTDAPVVIDDVSKARITSDILKVREPFAGQSSVPVVLYDEGRSVPEELPKAKESLLAADELMESLAEALVNDKPPSLQQVEEVVGDLVDSVVRNPNALLWLTKLRDQDKTGYAHAADTAIYMLAFGRHLGYPKHSLAWLGMAGLMLDIGKLRLPAELRAVTGRHTAEQYETMKTHVRLSLDILDSMGGVPMDVFDAVARHHERFDGSGYPYGLKGQDIGLFGSMAGIVDCFTALTSNRNYGVSLTSHEALQILHKWAEHYFHAPLVEQFAQCVGIFHVGTLVELSSGEIGIVVGQNRARRLKPRVMLIKDAHRKDYTRPVIVDLMTQIGSNPVAVRRELPMGAFGIDPRDYFQAPS